MMGTLAIMGILALAGIWMYNSAMDRLKANTIINEAQKRAVVVAGQIGFQGRTDPNLGEFSDNTFSGGTFSTNVITDGLYEQFGIQVSNVSKTVCQNILNAIGDTTPIRRLAALGSPTNPIMTCGESNSFLLIYNNNMSSSGNDIGYCNNSSCQTVCGRCIVENGENKCIDECPTGGNTCSSNADCSGDCVGCVIPSGQSSGTCQACQRVAYLQSAGTQKIDTGVKGDNDHLEFHFQFNILTFTRYGHIFGNRISDTHNTWRVLQGSTNNSSVFVSANKKATGGEPLLITGKVPLNTIHTMMVNQPQVILDGSSYTVSGIKGTANNENITLFHGNVGSNLRLYYFKIYDNGILVRDFVPVLDPWNVPAMFDKANNKLYYNSGTGQFTYGS